MRYLWVTMVAVVLAFLGIFFLWPVSELILQGFVIAGELNFSGLEIFTQPRTLRIIKTTLLIGFGGSVSCIILGLPGAYLLYRVKFRGRRWLRALVAVPFAMPTVVVGVAFKTLFADTWLEESFWAILCALVFFNFSVVVRGVGVLWASLDPRKEQAAAALGANKNRIWWTITLPRLAPAIAASGALVFLYCASSYGIVMVMGGVTYVTIETEIWYQTTQLLNLPAAAALSVLQLLVIALLLGITNFCTQSQNRQKIQVATELSWSWRRHWAVGLVVFGVVLGIIVTPLLLLLWRSLSVEGQFSLSNYVRLLEPVRGVGVTIWDSLWVTLKLALSAGLLSVSLGLMVTLLLSRRPRQRWLKITQKLFDSLFMLPLGISAVTLGFGFLITLNRPPFDLRSSPVLVPIAQAIVALPLVVRLLLPVLRSIDPRQREAASSLGANPWRVLGTIDFPAILRALGLAIGFALATSLGEFGATSFLATPQNPTLSVLIYRLISRPGADSFGAALAASVILALLTGTVMFIGELLRPKEASAG